MKKILSIFTISFLAISCGKGPETVTVTSDPLRPINFERDTSTAEQGLDGDEFYQLTLGEIGAIESLDPLFAESNSELRIISLIYDGLVKLDENGDPAPALASRWQVNNDSTRFTFHLRNNVRFHNSNLFSGDVGRQVTANDVLFTFERMASVLVPNWTAEQFSEIRGFSEYHNERTYIKNPAKRALQTISGIDVSNDSTIIFMLEESSSDFLNKLAHPSASIYAPESVREVVPPIQKSAGTGAFYLIKQEDDRHIFAVNQEYYGEIPTLNRLDVISGIPERELYQRLARQELDAIVEPSPSILTTVVDSSGLLLNVYQDTYELLDFGVHATYELYFNSASNQHSSVDSLLNALDFEVLRANPASKSLTIHELGSANGSANENQQIMIAQTNHPAELFFVNYIAERSAGLGYNVTLNASYGVSEDVTFSFRNFPDAISVLQWEVPVQVLTQQNASGIDISNVPWNINLSEVSVEGGR